MKKYYIIWWDKQGYHKQPKNFDSFEEAEACVAELNSQPGKILYILKRIDVEEKFQAMRGFVRKVWKDGYNSYYDMKTRKDIENEVESYLRTHEKEIINLS
jgi:hypothetical protein